MIYTEKSAVCGELSIRIYLPESTHCVVYIHTPDSEICGEISKSVSSDAALVFISGNNWECDFSPWSAPAVFRSAGDFSGGADEYLARFVENLLPECDSLCGFLPQRRFVAGYSLSGLFALYAMTKCDIFSGCASASGSLWFDRFSEYMQQNRVLRRDARIYLSLGDCEKKSRNRRMAVVEICTERCAEILRNDGINVKYEQNAGGHFDNVAERIAKSINYITLQ